MITKSISKFLLALSVSCGIAAAPALTACSDDDDNKASRLTILKDGTAISQLNFTLASGSQMLAVNTDGEWTAESSDTTWCRLQVHAGYGYADSLLNSYTRVTVSKNEGDAPRQATITVRAGSLTKVVAVSQNGMGTDPGDTFMSAFTLVEQMHLGYNLGNTLDSNPIGSWWNPVGKTPQAWEQSWGQPLTTQAIIDSIAAKGFNVIRIPVTWGIHCDENDQIDQAWMDRVHQVVDYVLTAHCFCILNVQHDTGSADNRWLYADMDDYDGISTRYKKIWQQIATSFREYSDSLVFEAFNEILDKSNNWGDPTDSRAYEAVNRLEQDFVDVVRATGGNNEYRNLMVNPYSAGSTQAKLDGMQLPTDVHANHLLCSVHSYDPYWFCNDDDNSDSQQWYIYMFNDQCREEIDAIFARVHKRFAGDFGVPYIFGEFGAIGSHPDMAERIKYAQYMVKKFREYDTTGLWWMGLFERRMKRWYEAEIVNALFADN